MLITAGLMYKQEFTNAMHFHMGSNFSLLQNIIILHEILNLIRLAEREKIVIKMDSRKKSTNLRNIYNT